MQRARETGKPVVVSELTSQTRLVTADPATGDFVAEVASSPVRVKDATGNWQDVDTTLAPGANGSLAPQAAATTMEFSAGGQGRLASLVDGGHSLGLSFGDELPTPVVEGSSATYPNVLPGVDLVVRAGVTGYATYFVVESREAASNPALDELGFDVDTGDLSLAEEADGGLVAADDTGSPVFRAPRPRMWDSTGRSQDSQASSMPAQARVEEPPGARVAALATEVTGSRLDLRPDRAFLSDSATEYPVIIDPSWESDTRTHAAWAMVWSNGTDFWNNSTEHARVGYDGWSSATKKSRVFYRFGMRFLKGKQVHSATLAHKLIHTPNWDCSLDTFGPAVEVWRAKDLGGPASWPGPKLVDHQAKNAKAHGHRDACSGWRRLEWDVTDAASDSAKNNWDRITLGMKSKDESNRNGWRKFDNVSEKFPIVTVKYNTKPNLPGAPTVVGRNAAGYIDELRPTIRVKISDPDGDQVRARFRVFTKPFVSVADSMVLEKYSGWVNSGKTAEITVPSGVLDNEDYFVEAKPDDGKALAEGNPPNTGFIVDTIPPEAPAVTVPSDATVDAASDFTFDSPSTDAVTYEYGFNTDAITDSSSPGTAGGPATVSHTPETFGPNWVVGRAVDRAGNLSALQREDFQVGGEKLTHQWRLDGDGVDAVGGETLTPSGNVAWPGGAFRYYSGTFDRDPSDLALGLDGAGAHAVGAQGTGVVRTDQNFSVTAWVRRADDWNGQPATAVGQAGANADAMDLGVSATGWRFTVQTGDDAASEQHVEVPFGDVNAQPGQWVHLTGVLDAAGKTISIHVNPHPDDAWTGVVEQSATAAVTDRPFAATAQLLVGAGLTDTGAVGRYFDGDVDEVRIYPGKLTEDRARRIAGETRP